MARTDRYWESETPSNGQNGIKVGDFVIKHYPQAGVVQFYNWIEGKRYTGLSKGVSLHLDALKPEDLERLASIFLGALAGEYKTTTARALPEPVPVAAVDPEPNRFKALLAKAITRRMPQPATLLAGDH